MPVKVRPHPAKFSRELYDTIRLAFLRNSGEYTGAIVDTFAGVGRIHEIFPANDTLAIEIEPEWAEQSAELGETWCGDFFAWEPDRRIAAIVTSVTYGNRMADHHEAKDLSYRATYRHALGRPLSENNSGGMQWGVEYRAFHIKWTNRCWEILAGGGLLILNVKNHIRKGVEVEVVEWFRHRMLSIGFVLLEDVEVKTPGMRRGENHQVRVECEHVMVFERPKTHSTWQKLKQEQRWREEGGPRVGDLPRSA